MHACARLSASAAWSAHARVHSRVWQWLCAPTLASKQNGSEPGAVPQITSASPSSSSSSESSSSSSGTSAPCLRCAINPLCSSLHMHSRAAAHAMHKHTRAQEGSGWGVLEGRQAGNWARWRSGVGCLSFPSRLLSCGRISNTALRYAALSPFATGHSSRVSDFRCVKAACERPRNPTHAR